MIKAELFNSDDESEVSIVINRIQDTNNFDFILTSSKESLPYEGTIYNHDGDSVELVRKVLDGRSMLR